MFAFIAHLTKMVVLILVCVHVSMLVLAFSSKHHCTALQGHWHVCPYEIKTNHILQCNLSIKGLNSYLPHRQTDRQASAAKRNLTWDYEA